MKTGHIVERSINGLQHRCSGFVEITDLGIGDAGEWYGRERVIFYSAEQNYTVEVPPLFISDLASIPRYSRGLMKKGGYERLAAYVHDWLCVTNELPRHITDAIFREACYVTGTPTTKRVAMYYAVRGFSVTLGRTQNYNRAAAHPEKHFINPNKPPQVNRRRIKIEGAIDATT